jgi:glycogen debranching enzyme
MMAILNKIRAPNDLGHPLCDNLRNGNWLMEYTANRLLAHPGTKSVSSSVMSPTFHPTPVMDQINFSCVDGD